MFPILLNLSGKIFLMVALGYFLRKRQIITAQFQKDITDFMMKVALPANVLTTASQTFSKELIHNLSIIVMVALAYFITALILTRILGRFLPLSPRGRTLFSVMSVFANTAFIGFPLISELLGTEGLLCAVSFNLVWILFFFTVGTSMMSGQTRLQLKSILSVPVSLASIIAVTVYLSPFRFPGFVQETFSALGAMVTPISMLIIGCSLVPVRLRDILTDRYSYAVSALRLVVFPLLVCGALYLIPGIPHFVAIVCVLMCCLPSASLCVVYAQTHDCEPEYASRAVVQGMLLMIATIPLLAVLVVAVFP